MIREIKVLLAIIGLFLVILVSGCTEQLNEGVIINKKYYPKGTAYIITGVEFQLSVSSSEKFCLLLQGNEKTELRCVSKKLYDSVHLGEYVILGGKDERTQD